jgi:hypothetical protein
LLNRNRNKRSVTIELNNAKGVKLLKRLCTTPDVIVQISGRASFYEPIVPAFSKQAQPIACCGPARRLPKA